MKLIPILSILLLVSCNNHLPKSANKNNDSIENFDIFYNKFHSDSIFQLSRIHFPLEGKYYEYDLEKEWEKDKWQMLKVKYYDIDTSEYEVEVEKTDDKFYESVGLKESGFSIELEFRIIENKWYLMLYNERNY